MVHTMGYGQAEEKKNMKWYWTWTKIYTEIEVGKDERNKQRFSLIKREQKEMSKNTKTKSGNSCSNKNSCQLMREWIWSFVSGILLP